MRSGFLFLLLIYVRQFDVYLFIVIFIAVGLNHSLLIIESEFIANFIKHFKIFHLKRQFISGIDIVTDKTFFEKGYRPIHQINRSQIFILQNIKYAKCRNFGF
jgi:hypothetical protein